MADPLSAFFDVKANTVCPFAAGAALGVGPTCVSDGGVVRLGGLPISLASYLQRFRPEHLSGYVWAIMGEAASTLDGTAALFARTLAALGSADFAPPAVPWNLVESASWQFSFAGERLFLNVFSPCYPTDHSKHLPSPDGIVVFAQPDDTFSFCGIDRTRQAVKEDIRRRFAAVGKGYDGRMIDRRIEASLYVFPLSVGDPPVRWWTDPALAPLRKRR